MKSSSILTRKPTMGDFNLKGLGVALITPFKSDKSIDFNALGNLIEYQINGNIDFLVALGTTGETATLSEEEKKDVRRFIVSKVNGRVPLVLGYGSNNTMELVKELESDDLSAFSAILSVVPFYNKPSQEGIFQHYKAVAEASPLPVILYNVPSRTGVNMSAETTLRIARECPNVIGVKEASGNFTQIEEIIKRKPDNFNVISGDDAHTYPLMTLGCTGVISVIGNAFPSEFGKMVSLCRDGEFEKAREIHFKFTELFNLLFVDGNPAGVKCTLNAMKMIQNELRLPLVPTRIKTNEEIHKLTEKIVSES